MTINSEVEIEAENGRLIINNVSPEFSLEELLANCSSEKVKVHDEDREWLESDVAGDELW